MKYKLYEHFKGGTYIKLNEALNTETNQTMVVYASVSSGKVFTRPKIMFYDTIDTKKYYGPRFREIKKG